jgi:hypothetical protein
MNAEVAAATTMKVSDRPTVLRMSFLPLIVHRSSFIVCIEACAAIVLALLESNVAGACPFCLAIEPTLAQRRESAAAVAVGEAAAAREGAKSQSFQLRTVLRGPAELNKSKPIDVASSRLKAGSFAILFADGDEPHERDRWEWTAAMANEALLGYFAAAPDLRAPAAKRLAYFVPYLEHAEADIARDAYLEFAHAPYEDVAQVADKFDFAKVRRWLESADVPGERKGFFGLVLGLAKSDKDRAANEKLLLERINRDEAEFRSGFDGMLAGYLLLTREKGLKFVEQRFFADGKARHGDVRHAASALRFYFEYGPKKLRDDVARTMARLIDRPEFAAAAVTDLARWEYWQVLEQVAGLFERKEFSHGPTRRAVVGFLKSCPKDEAAAALLRLRSRDPEGVAAAEQALLLPRDK